MTRPLKVTLIVGSLRKASFTRRIAKAALARARAELDTGIVEIGDLVLYNQDFAGDPPVPEH